MLILMVFLAMGNVNKIVAHSIPLIRIISYAHLLRHLQVYAYSDK